MEWLTLKLKSIWRRSSDKLSSEKPRKQSVADFISALQTPGDPFAQQLLRTLNGVSCGAAELGECLVTVAKLQADIPFDEKRERWFEIWGDLARRTEADAVKSAQVGHRVSAASAYLRAMEYYRQAGFFLRNNLDDPRFSGSIKDVQRCFQRHIECADIPAHAIEIPIEGSIMDGYWIRGYGAIPGEKRATVIIPGGYDAVSGEGWWETGKAAWTRGYHVLLLDGPGQGATLALRKLFFRPDYEVVMAAVAAWLQDSKADETDLAALVVVGRSFAGLLGARMASTASGVKVASVAVDPLQVDFKSALKKFPLPAEAVELFHAGKYDEMDALIAPMLEAMPSLRFHIMSRAVCHGISSTARYLDTIMNDFTCAEQLSGIECPVWTSFSEKEHVSVQGAEEYGGKIKDLTVHRFSQDADGALGHCEAGAAARLFEAMYDWVESKVPAKRESLLSSQIIKWLDAVPQEDHGGAVRAVIAPHAGYRYCGHVMGHAYKHINPDLVRRVFLLGPSHHFYSRECHLSPHLRYDTPLGAANIDTEIYEALAATGIFPVISSSADEAEHSLELHMPFIMASMQNRPFTLVPIVVGALSVEGEATYGRALAPYLADPANFFVISSDFCHWGTRFSYTFHNTERGAIHESIEWLDKKGMGIIEGRDPVEFSKYLKQYSNTICGRHPIAVFLQALQHAPTTPHTIKFTKYDQSHKCTTHRDSSVSYAAAVITLDAEEANGNS